MKFVLILLLSITQVSAQINLLFNNSFEYFNSCPTGPDNLNSVIGWFQPNVPGGSSDYFNSCSSNMVGVPSNYMGSQLAKSGNAYAGIITYGDGTNVREYLESQLLDTLKSNTTYCVSFYVSLSHLWSEPNDGIGAHFSQDSVLDSTFLLVPQIVNPSGNIISDMVNWVKIEGDFIASGVERFITIGNFRVDAQTAHSNPNPQTGGYFYLDDVSVTEGSCNVGIAEASESIFTIYVSPNPVKDQFLITVAEKNFHNLAYRIYGIDGQMVNDGILQRNTALVQSAELQSGLYLMQVYDNKGNISTTKIVKQ